MGVTVGVIQEAVRRAGLAVFFPDPAAAEFWRLYDGPLSYRPRPAIRPCPVVMLDGWKFEGEGDFLYVCRCRHKDKAVAVFRYSPCVPEPSPRFTMHFSRYGEGVQHPLKPAGVILSCKTYGVWVGQCPECMTIYVAQRELR